jgi:hypothetical protein
VSSEVVLLEGRTLGHDTVDETLEALTQTETPQPLAPSHRTVATAATQSVQHTAHILGVGTFFLPTKATFTFNIRL